MRLFAHEFAAAGVVPVMGAGSVSDDKQPEPLEPGSAVSAILVRGDMSIAGTCTVTYLDSTHLLACGHPLLQSGNVDLPMTKATVLATLADERETLLARVSGSGGTCFALCASDIEAEGLAERLEAMAPTWWVRRCRLGGPWDPASRDTTRPHGLDVIQALTGPGNWGINGDSTGRIAWARLSW